MDQFTGSIKENKPETPRIKIGFYYEDEFGNTYNSESRVIPMPDFGMTELNLIGSKLNCFLAQCGYLFEKDTILMESLTEDEAEELYDYLQTIREEKSNGQS